MYSIRTCKIGWLTFARKRWSILKKSKNTRKQNARMKSDTIDSQQCVKIVWKIAVFKYCSSPANGAGLGETNRPAGQSERGASETIRSPANGARAAGRDLVKQFATFTRRSVSRMTRKKRTMFGCESILHTQTSFFTFSIQSLAFAMSTTFTATASSVFLLTSSRTLQSFEVD